MPAENDLHAGLSDCRLAQDVCVGLLSASSV
jgi:hypothetical protein